MRASRTLCGVVLSGLVALPAAAQFTKPPSCEAYRAGIRADIDLVLAEAPDNPASEPVTLILDAKVTDWFSEPTPENRYTLQGVLCLAESVQDLFLQRVEPAIKVPFLLERLVDGSKVEIDRVERELTTTRDGTFRVPGVRSGSYRLSVDWTQVGDAEGVLWIVRKIRRCSPDLLIPAEVHQASVMSR